MKSVLDECMSAEQRYEFIPEIAPNELSSAAAQHEASKLLALVHREHENTIKNAIAEAFDAEVTKTLPEYMRTTDQGHLRKEWLKHRYYTIVQSVVSSVEVSNTAQRVILSHARDSSTGHRHDDMSTVPDMFQSPKKTDTHRYQ